MDIWEYQVRRTGVDIWEYQVRRTGVDIWEYRVKMNRRGTVDVLEYLIKKTGVGIILNSLRAFKVSVGKFSRLGPLHSTCIFDKYK